MIPTSDGSRASAFFAKMDSATAAALRTAVAHAISKAAELTAEVAVLAEGRHLDIIDQVQHNVAPIENTSLDVFADSLSANAPQGAPSIGAAIAAGTAGAVLAGASLGKVRGDLYHAGSVLGDVEAIASGNPRRIVRRGVQHIFWRALGRTGRSVFRTIGGKR